MTSKAIFFIHFDNLLALFHRGNKFYFIFFFACRLERKIFLDSLSVRRRKHNFQDIISIFAV